MSDAAFLAVHSLAYLGLLTALGSGLVLAWGPRAWDSALLAPIVGFAGAAAVLTSFTEVLPMRVGAWALLLPGAVISLAAAAWLGWKRDALRTRVSRSAAIPVTIGLLGLLLAIVPGLLRGTEGPINLTVYDGLGYIQADEWLQDHTARAALPPDAGRFDLSDAYGHALTAENQRIGVSAVNSATASLFVAEPDETHLPFLAALFSLLPLSIWVVARALGAGPAGAAFGSLFGLSPALLSLVGDSALGNLAALALIPSALLLGALWLRRGDLGTLFLASLLMAGIVAVYPEFVLPTLAIGALGVLALLIASRARLRDTAWLGSLVGRLALLALAPAAITPVGVARAYELLSNVGETIGGQPPRFLTGENGWAWAFGTLTLYELPRFEDLSGLKTAVAVGVPAALTLGMLVGLVRTTFLRAAFVVCPILVAIVTGLASFHRYQEGNCEYCLWKSLTLFLPFLGIGLGLALHLILSATLRERTAMMRAAAMLVAAAAVVLIVRSDVDLARAEFESAAVVTPQMRRIADLSRPIPDSAGLLLEGTDATAAPKWTTPASYYIASQDRNGPKISLVPWGDAGLYLGIGPDPGDQFYDPAYRFVLSYFGGVKWGRVALGHEGPFTLYRRARIDVTPVGTGWAFDPREGAHAIPWLQGPFQLWLSTGSQKGLIALDVGLERPLHDESSLRFSVGGRPVRAWSSPDGSRLCVRLASSRDPLVVNVEPSFDHPPVALGRTSETAPIQAPPKVLGLNMVKARRGTCLHSVLETTPVLGYGPGWYPPQQIGGTSWHWMRTHATLVVGSPGVVRPATQLTATLGSLAVARRLSVRLGGRVVQELAIPAGFTSGRLDLTIPGGRGQALVVLQATPGAQSAESVTPGDTRMLAVDMIDPRLQTVHGHSAHKQHPGATTAPP